MRRSPAWGLGALLGAVSLVASCTDAPGPSRAPATAAEAVDPGSPQRPPRGAAALAAWLAQNHHLTWRCEGQVSPPRLTGNHGPHRICSNELLREGGAGPFPVGAASVKELWGAGATPIGFAVGVKVEAGEGTNTWYWYERRGTSILADGTGLPQCAVCHVEAPRDYVFIRAE